MLILGLIFSWRVRPLRRTVAKAGRMGGGHVVATAVVRVRFSAASYS